MKTLLAAAVLAAFTFPAAAQVPGMPVAPVSAPVEMTPGSDMDAAMPAGSAVDPILAASELRDQVVGARNAIPASGGALRPAPATLRLDSGRNEIVQVARGQPNRFITPFSVPVVRYADDLTSVEVAGGLVYVTTASQKPVTIYIEDDANPANAFVLSLVPRDVPAVSVTLQMTNLQPGRGPASMAHAQAYEEADHFVAVLRDTFKELAAGRVPGGYGLAQGVDRRLVPECLMPGLRMMPGQTVTGADYVVYVSRLTNVSAIPQFVDEETCVSDRVLAVAAWPHVELMPGQSTELYIAMRREAAPAANARPSLID